MATLLFNSHTLLSYSDAGLPKALNLFFQKLWVCILRDFKHSHGICGIKRKCFFAFGNKVGFMVHFFFLFSMEKKNMEKDERGGEEVGED
jgi:hypothetical protein